MPCDPDTAVLDACESLKCYYRLRLKPPRLLVGESAPHDGWSKKLWLSDRTMVERI